MERSKLLLEKFEDLIGMIRSLCKEYLLQTATTRELLLGEWVREGSNTSFRIFEEDGILRIENRTANPVNDRIKSVTCELEKDEGGNMYFSFMENAVAYDRERDMLIVQYYGEFERKKTENEDT